MPDDKDKVVTQAEVDKVWKMYKETGEKLEKVVEKLDKTAAEKVELVTRVKKLEDEKKPPAYVPPEEGDLTKVYTEANPPQTEEEWNDLYDAAPSYAHDLKNKVTKVRGDWAGERDSAVKTVVEKHPDMYKRDAKGMLLKDANGSPIFDGESPKGKIWNKIAGKDPKILESATAPVIVMKAMELELKEGEEAAMKDKLKKDADDKEKDRQKKVDAAKLAAGGGNPPPPPEDNIEIKYGSEEEKKHVLRAIAAGRYKDEKDYFRSLRKGVGIGYGRGGF